MTTMREGPGRARCDAVAGAGLERMPHHPTASARRIDPAEEYLAAGRVEHVTIESREEIVSDPGAQPRRTTLRRCLLVSHRSACVTELSILQGHYLGVRSVRADGKAREYQFDLRFARPAPVREHHVPWAWLAGAAAVALLGAGALAWAWSSGASVREPFVVAGFFSVVIGIVALVASARRATTSLQVRSVHGNAPLVGVTDGLGSFRQDSGFFAELGSCTEAARRARPQEKQAYLCDQMREHYRLHQLGVLTDHQYESSKARILAAH